MRDIKVNINQLSREDLARRVLEISKVSQEKYALMRQRILKDRRVSEEPVSVERLHFDSPSNIPFAYDPSIQVYK